jgi:hypothetical protein
LSVCFEAGLETCEWTLARGVLLEALHLLRNRPELGVEVRTGDRAAAAAGPPSPERSMAPGRDGCSDRRPTDVPVAGRRPRGRGCGRREISKWSNGFCAVGEDPRRDLALRCRCGFWAELGR